MDMTINSSGLTRTKSDQLPDTDSLKSPSRLTEAGNNNGGGLSLSRKPSIGKLALSPGGGGRARKHIRKSRSAQLKLELDEVSSGAALSRASSASLGLSFSFAGFTAPPDDIANHPSFSDEDNGNQLLIKITRTICIFTRANWVSYW